MTETQGIHYKYKIS